MFSVNVKAYISEKKCSFNKFKSENSGRFYLIIKKTRIISGL